MSLLLNTCGQQAQHAEVHLAGRNYGMNNELKVWKESCSPLYAGVYGHRIFLILLHVCSKTYAGF